MYINNQQIYDSNGLYAHISYIKKKFEGALHSEGYNCEVFRDEFMEALLSGPSFTRRSKNLRRTVGFMLQAKLGVDFICTSVLLYPDMKSRLQLIRTGPIFYLITDNPSISLGFIDCSFYTRPILLKYDYQKRRMDMLELTPVEFKYLETLAKILIIPARKGHFNQ